MKKGIIVIFLALCLLTSSLFTVMAVDTQYLYKPIPYFERISYTFQNFPDADYLSYNEEWEDSMPEYESLTLTTPTWTNKEINSFADVFSAVVNFMNNLISYFKAFIKSLFEFFPKLWNNFLEAFKHWFTPVRVTISNFGTFCKTFFSAKDWFVCLGLAFIPCDWQTLLDECGDVRVPLFGNISKYPLDEYFYQRNVSFVGGD